MILDMFPSGLDVEEAVTQWAFEENLEVYAIKRDGETNRWTFSAVEAGKAGGWCADLAYENGKIFDPETGKVYKQP